MVKLNDSKKVVDFLINKEKTHLSNLNIDNRLIHFLKENKILIRFYLKYLKCNYKPTIEFHNSYKMEKNRIGNLESMIYSIVEVLDDYSTDIIFLKNYQHYPDMGDDIDILVLDNFSKIKNKLIAHLSFVPQPKSFLNRIGKKEMLKHRTNNIEVELHERLGRLGEFSFNNIFDIKRYTKEYNHNIFIPNEELKILIQVIQRVYTRSYLRLSEILSLSEIKKLDLDLIYSLSDIIKIREGLTFYFNIIDDFSRYNITNDKRILIYNNPYYKIPYSKTIPIVAKRLLLHF